MAKFIEIRVSNFADLQSRVASVVGDKRGFAFRGYYAAPGDKDLRRRALVTGLERVCFDTDNSLVRAMSREVSIAREFIRRAHHYLPDVPRTENWVEWLALMQHHGAPTRFLDWTYSLHVAAHFQGAPEGSQKT